jgi:DNA repair exonuclease SbcCD ATPase subunit
MAHQIDDIDGDTTSYTELSTRLNDVQQQIKIVSSARKLTKSGIIVRDIMDRFFDLVQLKVSEYSTLINLDHFNIKIVNERLGMVIQVFQGAINIPIELLSNGEKTRLSLLVLMAMLDAMKCISDSETNIIVLDEASSSFDASGVDELSRLFSHMKSLGQSIYLITHGSELDEVPYDYELKAIKHGGISSVSITHI